MAGHTPPAVKRYFARSAMISAAYVASVTLGVWIIPDDAPADPLTIALALVPGIIILGWIWAMGRLLIELNDEYLRMLEVRKMLIATAITLSVTSVWGILELYSPEVTRMPVFFVFPMWCLGLAMGALFNKLTLGDAGTCA